MVKSGKHFGGHYKDLLTINHQMKLNLKSERKMKNKKTTTLQFSQCSIFGRTRSFFAT